MDANLKAEWVKALRSGRFGQTRFELENEGCFCCLGVLCEVADIDKVDIGPAYRKLDSIVGDYGPLVDLNDNEGKSFAEIADWIEANL